MKKTFEKFKNYILVWAGDFNINFLSLKSYLTREEIRNKNEMIDLLGAYNFQQTIFDITRPNKYKKSCIDNIFINSKTFFNNQVIKTGISDHHAQSVSINVSSAPRLNDSFFRGRIFSRSKLCQFQEAVQDCAWAGVLGSGDVDRAYNSFISIITCYLNLIFPKKK